MFSSCLRSSSFWRCNCPVIAWRITAIIGTNKMNTGKNGHFPRGHPERDGDGDDGHDADVHQLLAQHLDGLDIAQNLGLQRSGVDPVMVANRKHLHPAHERGAQAHFDVADGTAQIADVNHRRRNVLNDENRADGGIDPERFQSAGTAVRNNVNDVRRDDRQDPDRAGLEQRSGGGTAKNHRRVASSGRYKFSGVRQGLSAPEIIFDGIQLHAFWKICSRHDATRVAGRCPKPVLDNGQFKRPNVRYSYREILSSVGVIADPKSTTPWNAVLLSPARLKQPFCLKPVRAPL